MDGMGKMAATKININLQKTAFQIGWMLYMWLLCACVETQILDANMHMRFRLAPRSMTLDDLEVENNLFSSFGRQYLANSTHRYRALTFATAGLSCIFMLSFLIRMIHCRAFSLYNAHSG